MSGWVSEKMKPKFPVTILLLLSPITVLRGIGWGGDRHLDWQCSVELMQHRHLLFSDVSALRGASKTCLLNELYSSLSILIRANQVSRFLQGKIQV